MHVQLTGCCERLGAVWQIEEDGVVVRRWFLACLAHSLCLHRPSPSCSPKSLGIVMSWMHVDAN